VFETLAVLNGKAIWLNEHIARMENAVAELGIGFDKAALLSGITAVLQRCETTSEVLRFTLSRGKTGRGLGGDGHSPSLLITLNEFAAPAIAQPCHLKISSIRRNEFAPSSRMKTLSYIDGIAVAREIAGQADEALMLNTAGHVASATIANIFLIVGQELITPSLNQGILPGITRNAWLETASQLALRPVERVVMLEELFRADTVFLCNSLRPLRPVGQLNETKLKMQSLDDLERVFMKGLIP
jgi:branched-chain amino acid aminotransferase